MEPADILRHSAAPRYWKGDEQCVETRIVETFPDGMSAVLM
jgi:hypothetical protein